MGFSVFLLRSSRPTKASHDVIGAIGGEGGGDGEADGGGDGEADGGASGGLGGEQKLADQLYSFVKVETFFHASCISCLLQSSDSSAVPSNVRRIVVTELASQTSSWLKALAL